MELQRWFRMGTTFQQCDDRGSSSLPRRRYGATSVITYPLDDDVRSFYEQWSFEDFPFEPCRAMMVRMIDLRRAFWGEAASGG
jgi:hypothetical protein